MTIRTLETKCFRAPRRRPRANPRGGSVLLEVILALALFVGAATIISSGINASVRSVDRLRFQTHAMNLAISVLSEMHMHARPIAAIGPEPFPTPFQDWNYKVEIAQTETAIEAPETLRPVEVVIRHSHENVVQRLGELFLSTDISGSDTNSLGDVL